MAYYDLPIAELREYTPDLAIPSSLDGFWASTLAEARKRPLDAKLTRIDTGLTVVETFDVEFAGFGGSSVRGWLHLPVSREARVPAVVEFLGYGGGRGLPHERILFAAAGYGHLIMDTRGQGSGWSAGDTADPDRRGAPAHPGFMTDGILDPQDYYYRRVFTDAVRAVELARDHQAIDPGRVAVTGASQGGGISLAVSGLVDGLAAVAPDVPFLCDFRRAIGLVDTLPYHEIARYLKVHRDHVDRALDTLAYFDGAILGRRATAPALFSVALMDETCPPSTVYAAFNHYGGPKRILEYPFNDHEGGEAFHDAAKLRWLAEILG